jgi:hypothetical protein
LNIRSNLENHAIVAILPRRRHGYRLSAFAKALEFRDPIRAWCGIMLCQGDGENRERRIMDQAYEAVGLRDNGDVYAIQVLGQQTKSFATDLAQELADRWQVTVNLYRVPFVSHEKQWRVEQMELVQQLLPTRSVSRRGFV